MAAHYVGPEGPSCHIRCLVLWQAARTNDPLINSQYIIQYY